MLCETKGWTSGVRIQLRIYSFHHRWAQPVPFPMITGTGGRSVNLVSLLPLVPGWQRLDTHSSAYCRTSLSRIIAAR
jgi:hypothetical protein